MAYPGAGRIRFGCREFPVLGEKGRILSDLATYAGTGDFALQDGPLAEASFREPGSVLVLSDGSEIVSDTRSQVIRRIQEGKVSTLTGVTVEKDSRGFPVGGLLDGPSGASLFREPEGLAADASGRLYVADPGNHAVRVVRPDGKVSTLAGNGQAGLSDGIGGEARFNHPRDVAVTADGVVYVADTLNHAIRRIDPSGKVTTLNHPSSRVVEAVPGKPQFAGNYRDGRLDQAEFNEPSGLVLDAKGNLYVSDTGNQRIRYIDLRTGTVTTAAGGETGGSRSLYGKDALYAEGDFADGPAGDAKFHSPRGLALDAAGALLIADSLNHSIRRFADGRVTTIAGEREQFVGELDGIEESGELHLPADVAVRADGSLLVADSYNNKLRQITYYSLPAAGAGSSSLRIAVGEKTLSLEAEPELTDGRTMVPVRQVAESLGYRVDYLHDGRRVRLTRGSRSLEFAIGQKAISVQEGDRPKEIHTMDTAPYLSKDRTFVPVRFFAEEAGFDVQWLGTEKLVIIRDPYGMMPR
ncbi:stalk domain-containing protein [Paenibacillus sp. CC-CFT747]|nr:stalk domain-containing protein [Paenibacillus sp. CC-CFT747]